MNISLSEIKEKVEPILSAYGITYAGVFGSVARGDNTTESDVDILVRIGKSPFSLLDLIGFEQDLSSKLGKKVDVVSENAIIPYFKDYIYRDLKTIYEK